MEENFEIDEDENIDNEGFINLIEEEHIIIDEYVGKISTIGKYTGIEKNKYWNLFVRNDKKLGTTGHNGSSR